MQVTRLRKISTSNSKSPTTLPQPHPESTTIIVQSSSSTTRSYYSITSENDHLIPVRELQMDAQTHHLAPSARAGKLSKWLEECYGLLPPPYNWYDFAKLVLFLEIIFLVIVATCEKFITAKNFTVEQKMGFLLWGIFLTILVWYIVLSTWVIVGSGEEGVKFPALVSKPISRELEHILNMGKEEYMVYREVDKKIRKEEKTESAEWRDWGRESSESEDEPLWIRKRKTRKVKPAKKFLVVT
jgi:hypothetical protein